MKIKWWWIRMVAYPFFKTLRDFHCTGAFFHGMSTLFFCWTSNMHIFTRSSLMPAIFPISLPTLSSIIRKLWLQPQWESQPRISAWWPLLTANSKRSNCRIIKGNMSFYFSGHVICKFVFLKHSFWSDFEKSLLKRNLFLHIYRLVSFQHIRMPYGNYRIQRSRRRISQNQLRNNRMFDWQPFYPFRMVRYFIDSNMYSLLLLLFL